MTLTRRQMFAALGFGGLALATNHPALHAFDQAAANAAYDIDLMRALAENDAAALGAIELGGQARIIEPAFIIP